MLYVLKWQSFRSTVKMFHNSERFVDPQSFWANFFFSGYAFNTLIEHNRIMGLSYIYARNARFVNNVVGFSISARFLCNSLAIELPEIHFNRHCYMYFGWNPRWKCSWWIIAPTKIIKISINRAFFQLVVKLKVSFHRS